MPRKPKGYSLTWRHLGVPLLLVFSPLLAIDHLQPPGSRPDTLSRPDTDPEMGFAENEAAPIYFRLKMTPEPLALAKGSAANSQAVRDGANCRRFLAQLAPRIKSGNAEDIFRIEPGERESNRAHFHVRQLLGGIPVFGAEGNVVLRPDSVAIYIGRFRNEAPAPDGSPVIPPQAALEAAWKDLGAAPQTVDTTDAVSESVTQREKVPELVYFPVGYPAASSGFKLAWHLAIRPDILHLWEYLVDAKDGSILLRFPDHFDVGASTASAKDLGGSSRSFGTYQNPADSKYYLIDASRPMFNASRSKFPDQTVGTIVTMDMKNTPQSRPVYSHITSTDNTWANATAVSAHYNATVAYQYYLDTFGRNSINGSGGNIRSFINVPETDGQAMDNAFWNGNAMYYGNGRTSMKPLAGGLDVAGHELTHGVVGATAALQYLGQSGALNESLADIFGAMIERRNWKIGEDVVKTTAFPTGALRDMSNPSQGLKKGANGWQPGHMDDYQKLPLTSAGDMGGVHANSGITNRAFYLFATAVGKEMAEQVYYKALTQYLTASSQFVDMRLAVATACQDLYGSGSAQEKAAEEAFATVGIGAPASITPKANSLALHSGLQFVLLTRAGSGDGSGNTLYLADSNMTHPQALSRTALASRPSVTDDGATAIFVAVDGRIMRVNTDPANPRESVLENNPVWEIAAISKDGLRFAALKKAHDSSLYVGEIASGKIQRFPLYNPTNEGVRTGGVMYAGSLDWDISGENVIYDAFNHLQGTGNSAIEYWDIGLMNVWDNVAKQFATGDIRKPLGNLPDGASIGNPVFAKNSPDIVVYEFIDAQGALSIRTIDLNTRKTGTLTTNTIVGFPSYDKRDSGIAFTTRSGTDTVIAWIGLKADKITAGTSPKTVATGFKWPVVFARGNRLGAPTTVTPRLPLEAKAFAFRVDYRQSSGQVRVAFNLNQGSTVHLTVFDAGGKRLATKTLLGLAGANRFAWPMAGGVGPGLRFFRLETSGVELFTKAFLD